MTRLKRVVRLEGEAERIALAERERTSPEDLAALLGIMLDGDEFPDTPHGRSMRLLKQVLRSIVGYGPQAEG